MLHTWQNYLVSKFSVLYSSLCISLSIDYNNATSTIAGDASPVVPNKTMVCDRDTLKYSPISEFPDEPSEIKVVPYKAANYHLGRTVHLHDSEQESVDLVLSVTSNLREDIPEGMLCVDSGATRHMFSHKNPRVIKNIEEPMRSRTQVKFADGSTTQILGEGVLQVNGYLLKGLILPFDLNLISAKDLAVEYNLTTSLNKTGGCIHNDDFIFAELKIVGNLYGRCVATKDKVAALLVSTQKV